MHYLKMFAIAWIALFLLFWVLVNVAIWLVNCLERIVAWVRSDAALWKVTLVVAAIMSFLFTVVALRP